MISGVSGLKKRVVNAINSMIRPSGVQLVRTPDKFEDYIPFAATQAGARAAGLSVGDYIDSRFNVPGSTQDTIDRLAELGVFERPLTRVCEIGPGSGRYLEKVAARCRPERYEIYETAADWRRWLVDEYAVIAQPTDGRTLAATPDTSIDLVHTHKVLNGLEILDICRYFEEMVRVADPHATIVFDILTEACLDEPTLQKWLDSGAGYITSMTAQQFAIDFFTRHGFEHVGSFFATSMPGKTHYQVFRR